MFWKDETWGFPTIPSNVMYVEANIQHQHTAYFVLFCFVGVGFVLFWCLFCFCFFGVGFVLFCFGMCFVLVLVLFWCWFHFVLVFV